MFASYVISDESDAGANADGTMQKDAGSPADDSISKMHKIWANHSSA